LFTKKLFTLGYIGNDLVWIIYRNYDLTEINFAIFQTDALTSLLISTDEKNHKNCRITSSPELKAYQVVTMQVGMPKGNRYAPVFSEYADLIISFKWLRK